MPRNPQLDHDRRVNEHSALTLRRMTTEHREHFLTIRHLREELTRLDDALPHQIHSTLHNARAFRDKWGFDWWEPQAHGAPTPRAPRPDKAQAMLDSMKTLGLSHEQEAEFARLLGIETD